jgi:hypothetical protein
MHQDLMNGTRSGDTSKLSRDEIASLNAQMAGDVLTPSDNEFEEARHVWNGMIDAQPMLIVRCRETSDVVHAVNFARAANIAWTRKVWDELKRYSNDGVYMNFAGSGEEHDAIARNVYASIYDRLVKLQAHVDPAGLFRKPR